MMSSPHDWVANGYLYEDYIHEAEFTSRLNRAGCNEVITVIDWFHSAEIPGEIKICYEWAPHGDLAALQEFYTANHLILPEAFLWHIFTSAASALAYCHDGTNIGYRVPGWEPIIHSDLKPANIFVFPPTPTSPLYPSLKLADLGISYSIPSPSVSSYWAPRALNLGTVGFLPPENHARAKIHSANTHRANTQRSVLTDPDPFPPSTHPTTATDIWTLGLVIRRLIALIHRYVPKHLYQQLVASGHKRPFYSPALNRLVEICMAQDPARRPPAHRVWKLCCHFGGLHAEQLERREKHARGKEVFLGQVLYEEGEQERYAAEAGFRAGYQEANRGPLRDWLGVSRRSWEELDPDWKEKGVGERDLVVFPVERFRGVEEDEGENARLVLEKERFGRWVKDYFEAAGRLVAPRERPGRMEPLDEDTVKVLTANWGNVPKARRSSVEMAERFFQEYGFEEWRTENYESGDWFGSDAHYNGGGSSSSDETDSDDFEDNPQESSSSSGNSTQAPHAPQANVRRWNPNPDTESLYGVSNDGAGAGGGGGGGNAADSGQGDGAEGGQNGRADKGRKKVTFADNVRVHIENRLALKSGDGVEVTGFTRPATGWGKKK
ncbi:MAG: hypothetical protein Q9195_003293 [Heterodermia aff. obscurata]